MNRALLVLLCALVAGCSSSKPKGGLEQTISSAISLLEAKHYEQFARLMIPPNRLAEFKKEGLTVPRIAEGYRKFQGEQVLNILKQLDGQTPELSEDGSLATFAIPKELDPNGKGLVHFAKVDGKWYAKD